MPVTRYAREDDIAALIAVSLRAWEQAAGGVADISSMLSVAERAFTTFVERNWLSILLVEEDGTVAGWSARDGHDAAISDLWVDPLLQGRGLGTMLLAETERLIVTEGYDTVTLQTHARNEQAIAFFRARGYSVHWLTTAYVARLDRDVESIGLRKVLIEDEADKYGNGAYG